MTDVLKIGIGGPVGSGKTAVIEKICKAMRDDFNICVITNDIYTKEDERILIESQAIAADRIMGVETGGCPHTAIREDASVNITAIHEMLERHPDTNVLFVESGGDNLASTFSPELVDLSIFVISTAEGEEIPRKGGPGITKSDLLIINKIDLAPYVEVSVDIMYQDAVSVRQGRPVVLSDMKKGEGCREIVNFIKEYGGLYAK